MNRKTDFKQLKILVIEGNSDHWIWIEKAVHSCFAELLPVRVASIDKAQKLLEGYSIEEWEVPSLILLDLHLPTIDDGLNLLKYIRTTPPCRTTPILALSTSDAKSTIIEAYERGVSSYSLKPNKFNEWVSFFESLRNYWLEIATLPPKYYSAF